MTMIMEAFLHHLRNEWRAIVSFLVTALVLTALAFAFTGCSTAPAGSGLLGWWTARGERAAAQAETKVTASESAILQRAQERVQEAVVALLTAPASRPVEVASEATAQASALLAQVNGPLTVAQLASVRQQVEALLSDNAALRAEGERLRAEKRQADATASEQLTALRTQLEAADLRAAKIAATNARTAALYLRAKWAAAGLGALTLLATAGGIYLKLASGNATAATGELLALIDRRAPALSTLARGVADSPLWQTQQAKLAGLVPQLRAAQDTAQI
jgi:regulator of replication initiation timing